MKKKNLIGKILVLSAMFSGIVGCTNNKNSSSSSPESSGEVHEHNLSKITGQSATCSREGTEDYYQCDDCLKMFSDLNAENEIFSPVLKPKADHALLKVNETDSTCKVAGHEAYWECAYCYKMFSDEEGKNEISSTSKKPLASHSIIKVDAKDSTCVEQGHEAYYQCSICETMFSDEAGTTEIEEATKKPLSGHSVVKVDARPGNEVSAGIVEHYRCSGCGETYSDAAGRTPLARSEIYTESTGPQTWKPMSDVIDPTLLGYENGEITFSGKNNSYYLDDVFVDNNGEEIVGPYNSKTANTEYTFTIKIKATGSFALVLYCDDAAKTTYEKTDISNKESKRLGFYVHFNSEDEKNIQIEAALGNGTSEKGAKTGIQAKGTSSFKFDGTENTVQIKIERYSVDKLISHIVINGEEISLTKVNSYTVDYIGFNFRPKWDRTDLVGGIGDKAVYSSGTTSSHISCSRRLSTEEGYAAGLGVAITGESVVKLSGMEKAITGEQVKA